MATAIKLKSDIKKLKAAIASKATPKSFLPKLKSQLEKAENELNALSKGAKPRKTSTTKGTKVTLSALQKLIQKKKYRVYQGQNVSLEKDAKEGAMAIGRRESKGLKSNQFGSKSENKGNVYYEYRPNRLDVKQPRKKQTYPKLEKGGGLEETVEVFLMIKPRFVKELEEKAKKDGIEIEFYETNEDGNEVYRAEMNNGKLQEYKKTMPIEYKYNDEYASGGQIKINQNKFGKSARVKWGKDEYLVEWISERPTKNDVIITDENFAVVDEKDPLHSNVLLALLKAIKEGKVETVEEGKFAKGGEIRYKLSGNNFGQQIESGQKFKELIKKAFESQTSEHKYPENFIKEIAFTGKIVKNDGSNYLKDYTYKGTLTKFEFLDNEYFLQALKYLDRPTIKTMKFEEGGEIGGRGWGKYDKGERVTSIDGLKVGKSYLMYNPQFNSKNIVRITSGDKTPLKRDIVYAGYVRDINDKKVEGDFAIWGNELESNEFYEIKSDKMERGGYMAKGGMVAGRYYKDAAGNELRFIGESGGMGLFRDKDGNAIKKDFEDFINAPKETKLFGWFGNGGSLKSSTEYVPNRNIKELSVIMGNNLKNLKGSDIVDGIYVKKSALTALSKKVSTKKSSSLTVDDAYNSILKKADELGGLNEGDDKKIKKSEIKKLINAGYDIEDINIIYLGADALQVAKIDKEYSTIDGLMSLRDDAVSGYIDRYVKAAKEGKYELGLKYPNFNWADIVKKYKISTHGKEIDGKPYEYSNEKEHYVYTIFEGDKVVLGTASNRVRYKDGKKQPDDDYYKRDPKELAKFQGGYWGLVSSSKEVIKDIARMILRKGNGYVKDVTIFLNSLGGVDAEDLDINNIKYAKGGGIYSSDSMYVLTVLKDGKEVGTERFRAKNIKEAIEIGEEYEEKYKMKFGDMLNFKVSEAMEKGGYNTGASWTSDRARHNKSEDYEIPMNKRKLEYGGELHKSQIQ